MAKGTGWARDKNTGEVRRCMKCAGGKSASCDCTATPPTAGGGEHRDSLIAAATAQHKHAALGVTDAHVHEYAEPVRRAHNARLVGLLGYEEAQKWKDLGVRPATCVRLKRHGVSAEAAATPVALASAVEYADGADPDFADFAREVPTDSLAHLVDDGLVEPENAWAAVVSHRADGYPLNLAVLGSLQRQMQTA